MAKKAILDVLESTIGKYVHNLDAQSLNVAVWSGKVQLSKLELNTEAVNQKLARQAIDSPALAIPLRVVGGQFDTFQVDVPWAKLTSKPVVLRAKGLTVVVEPYDHLAVEAIAPSSTHFTSPTGKSKLGSTIKSKATAVIVKTSRDQSLQEADEARIKYNAIRKLTSDDESTDSSAADLDDLNIASGNNANNQNSGNNFLSRLVRRIVENLQVEIDHVRIEMRGCGCSAGLVLKSLSLVSTDEKGERAFIDRSNSKGNFFLHKELDITGLGIYCDEDKGLPYTENYAHSYILAPLSFQAKLRQADSMKCVDFAKYLVTSQISQCSILVARRQLELLHNVYTTLLIRQHRSNVSKPLFPEYRPSVPICGRQRGGGNARIWWKYAVRCIGRLTRRTSWVEFHKAFLKRKDYIQLYKRHLSNVQNAGVSWHKSLSLAESDRMNSIERDTSITVEGIMLWRNMADAQLNMERQKQKRQQEEQRIANCRTPNSGTKTTSRQTNSRDKTPNKRHSSLIGSLFGAKEVREPMGRNASAPPSMSIEEDSLYSEPPITLTTEELKELEALQMEQSTELMLSKDSKLYDFQFRLGAFKMDFITASRQALAKLQMGTVATSFSANADGSFSLDYSMSNLQIDDRLTYHTLFRSVVRTVLSTDEDNDDDNISSTGQSKNAFRLKLQQNNNGDCNLLVRGAAVEVVASPVLLTGVKEFITIVPTTPSYDIDDYSDADEDSPSMFHSVHNPLMKESTSGSIDLFFDAKEGNNPKLFGSNAAGIMQTESIMFVDETTANAAKDAASRVSDKLSQALADAWSVKNRSDRRWTIDLDIHAPIFVLPQNCTDPKAVTLVLNFGRFGMKSQNEPTPNMLSWFEGEHSDVPCKRIECWKIETKELSFVVGSAGEQDWSTGDKSISRSVDLVKPLSMTMHLGTEASDTTAPRTFVDGVIPEISLQISPKQIQQVLVVMAAWQHVIQQLRGDLEERISTSASKDLQVILEGSGSVSDEENYESLVIKPLYPVSKKVVDRSDHGSQVEALTLPDRFFARFALRRFSLSFFAGDGDKGASGGLEAHLISAVFSHSETGEGAKVTQVTMGWFWILDRLQASYPRRQRLLAHSNLPESANTFAQEDKYNIIDCLQCLGVFDASYKGSNDLADITIMVPGKSETDDKGESATKIKIDALFSSLIINWNPYAVKSLIMMQEKIILPALEKIKESSTALGYINSAPVREYQGRLSFDKHDFEAEGQLELMRIIFLNARMESFAVNFQSAKDDLNLFSVTMSRAMIDVVLDSSDESFTAVLELGDFRTETSPNSRTLPLYRTILGLAPNQSSSLLTVRYYKGAASILASGMKDVNPAQQEACAEVDLSPMRFIHIHAQVITMIDYFQEGVLAPFAARNSAPSPSPNFIQPVMVEKIFDIRATGFELVVPHAAYANDYFKFRAGELKARYSAAANNSGGDVDLHLKEMIAECHRGIRMVKKAVNMSLQAWVGPNTAPKVEDRVIRAKICFTEAFFLVTRNHFEQILFVCKRNFQEDNTFLRDNLLVLDDKSQGSARGKLFKINGFDTSNLTHAGTQALIVKKRIFLDIKANVISMIYCSDLSDEPVMEMAALKSELNVAVVPDMCKISFALSLQNLYLEDRRKIAQHQTFCQLFSRFVANQEEDQSPDVFNLTYDKDEKTGATEIDVKVGAPQLVILPDLINEIIELSKIPGAFEQKAGLTRSDPLETKSAVSINVSNSRDEIETAMTDATAPPKCSVTKLSFRTSTCRMLALQTDSYCSNQSKGMDSELIVLQGKVDATIRSTKEYATGTTLSNEAQVNGESFEIFTAFGRNIANPVQVMEPARFSIFFTKSVSIPDNAEDLVLKAVALTQLNICFSLQNAALVSAITSSIKSSFEASQERTAGFDGFSSVNDNILVPLTEKECNRIEHLSLALEHGDHKFDASFATVNFANTIQRNQSNQSSFEIMKDIEFGGRPMTRYFDVHLTMPDATLSIVNDFSGLDNPLFKLRARNLVGKGQLELPQDQLTFFQDTSRRAEYVIDRTKFQLRLNSSIMANYFDPTYNLWEPLLLKPWETTVTFQRSDKHRFQRKIERMSTDFDIESQRCLVSFSEQFLVSVGAATRMWNIYSEKVQRKSSCEIISEKDRVSAKALVLPTPYGIENETGIPVEYVIQPNLNKSASQRHLCASGETHRFRFEYPRGSGVGGTRQYGQDSGDYKEIDIFVGAVCIHIKHLDAELNSPRHFHDCGNGIVIFSDVVKKSRVMIIRLRSRIHVYNKSSIPFAIAVQNKEGISDIGFCVGCPLNTKYFLGQEDSSSLNTPSLGIPVTALKNFIATSSSAHADAGLTVLISPITGDGALAKPSALASFYEGNTNERWGAVALPPPYALIQMADGEDPISTMDVLCAQVGTKRDDEDSTMVASVCVRVSLVDEAHPFVELIVMPRAVLQNTLPISVLVRTPLTQTFSRSKKQSNITNAKIASGDSANHTIHLLQPLEVMEVFSVGPSIPISLKCADDPIAGAATGWLDGVWVDIPLGHLRLSKPVHGYFPFIGQGRRTGGMDVYICEKDHLLLWRSSNIPASNGSNSKTTSIDVGSEGETRTIVFAAANYAIDHTGFLLFEVFRSQSNLALSRSSAALQRESSHFWSAFIGSRHKKRVSLLPDDSANIRVLYFPTKEGEVILRSLPFRIEEIAICDGGIQSSAILWEDNTPSGFFAYRKMIGASQSEVHLVPEFVIINSGEANVIVRHTKECNFPLAPGKMRSIKSARGYGVLISIEIPDVCGETKPMKVDTLGTRIRVVRSSVSGEPIGSLAVQTVVGTTDSRLAIKIGAVKFGGLRKLRSGGGSLFSNDFFRLRVRWSQLEVTLNDTGSSPIKFADGPLFKKALQLKISDTGMPSTTDLYSGEMVNGHHKPVAQIQFVRFTVDFQCIYKDVDYTDPEPVISDAERSQLSLIVHNLIVKDRDPSAESSIVLESASPANFIDLCIRCRGPLDADLVKVDLIDLKLAFSKGKSETIKIDTSEEFLWRLLDVTNRIIIAISDLTGINPSDIDEAQSSDALNLEGEEVMDKAFYTTPKSDKLFDIKTAQVSPICLLVSFKRQPQTSRYSQISTIKLARLVNYFVRQLKFSVDRAELKFAGYKANDVKGPAGRAFEIVKEVYVSRMKFQLLALVSAVSIQEWKALSARSEGNDEYIEGDVLRMTGHIVGRSAGYMFKKFGEGIGEGLSSVTGSIGEGVENATDMIGLGLVGSGVNNVVSGLGDGVASTVKGVGFGASKVVKGAGMGAGQVLGGVGGGLQLAAKGISRGVTRGDSSAVISGLSDGAASAMLGVGQGLETAFFGATDGVSHVGQGLFSGITSVGRGLGDALTGQRRARSQRKRDSRQSESYQNPK